MAAKRKTRKAPSGKARVFQLEDEALTNVHMMLFTGNALGGQALEALLDRYREQGPYSPARNGLLLHMRRVVAELECMDATIIARCHLDPNRKLPKTISRMLDSVKRNIKA